MSPNLRDACLCHEINVQHLHYIAAPSLYPKEPSLRIYWMSLVYEANSSRCSGCLSVQEARPRIDTFYLRPEKQPNTHRRFEAPYS